MNKLILIVVFLGLCNFGYSQRIPEGRYKQFEQSWGANNDCNNCLLTISYKTKDIVMLISNNSIWGSAYFDSKAEKYYGKIQFLENEGGSYSEVYDIVMYYKNGILYSEIDFKVQKKLFVKSTLE